MEKAGTRTEETSLLPILPEVNGPILKLHLIDLDQSLHNEYAPSGPLCVIFALYNKKQRTCRFDILIG